MKDASVHPSDLKRFAEVVIDTPVGGLDRPFHYAVPSAMRRDVEIGSLVLVPFANRLALGYVTGFPVTPDVPPERMKSVARVVDEPPVFDHDGMRLCKWIADRYLCSLSQAFRLVMPPGRSRKVKQYVTLREDGGALPEKGHAVEHDVVEVLSAAGGEMEMSDVKKHLGSAPAARAVAALEDRGIVKRRFALSDPSAAPKSRLVARLNTDAATAEELGKLPERQRDVVEHLLSTGGVEYRSDLLRATGASASSVTSLQKKGLLEVLDEEVLRDPRLGGSSAQVAPPVPDPAQQEAIEGVLGVVEEGLPATFLLEGVTGSGKTEVYLRCIEKVLEEGKTAIVLVPEISLTPQTLERFSSRFPGDVAVLHSRLGPGERFDQWRGIREGRYHVVVGARSALFAPVSDLGLIAIDEEHEPTYKSDTAPRYHAREVAEARARMSSAVVVLGSATPAFESVVKARAGAYRHLVLPRRIDDRPMPSVEVVDMREVGGAGTVPLVSARLLDALSRTVEAGEQAILFLNRRGFANYLQCTVCGHIPGCDECEVSMSYHSRGNILLCHHCDTRRSVPAVCPECSEGALKQFGAGTQRVEEEVERNLPGVKVIRMDTDTTKKKDAHWHLLGRFRAGEAQVLIGTQMIAKGLDIPGVTLVGIINADTALSLPDFRASERTYQLLTQVGGRAGRGTRPGRVVVQTFNPEHPAILALTGNVEDFIEEEIEVRRRAKYPPYVALVNILVTSADASAAARSAERMKSILGGELEGSSATLLGPAPAPLPRLRGQYRWHILVKCGDVEGVGEKLRQSVNAFYEYARRFPTGAEVRVSLDVDPTSLL